MGFSLNRYGSEHNSCRRSSRLLGDQIRRRAVCSAAHPLVPPQNDGVCVNQMPSYCVIARVIFLFLLFSSALLSSEETGCGAQTESGGSPGTGFAHMGRFLFWPRVTEAHMQYLCCAPSSAPVVLFLRWKCGIQSCSLRFVHSYSLNAALRQKKIINSGINHPLAAQLTFLTFTGCFERFPGTERNMQREREREKTTDET